MDAYQKLADAFERHYLLRSAADQLEWDAQTMMPSGGGELRAAQLGVLRQAAHEALCAPELPELLATLEARPPSEPWQAANVRAMRHELLHATAVPAELIKARTEAQSACQHAWPAARRDDDFALLLPSLREVFELTKQYGQAKADALGLSLYDALLDEFEPGLREAHVAPLFATLGAELPALLDQVIAQQARRPAAEPLPGPLPIALQEQLGRRLAERVGFDWQRGRMDTSAHPFCGGAAEDVRITTRYNEHDFLEAALGVVHESGHALYEQGLPRAWVRQPVGRAVGMAAHESQSLLIEMQACRSPEFLQFLAGEAREVFGEAAAHLSAEQLRARAHKVERSLIRVDADEVSYPLHILVRYELERALFAGDLALADLPAAFREAMAAKVGVHPPSDRDGCLQDVHWPSGAFGYFPSYTLGAVFAAQLFDAACKQSPALLEELSRGEFTSLRAFMRDRVHAHGARHSTPELAELATGSPLDPQALLAHLRRRYLH